MRGDAIPDGPLSRADAIASELRDDILRGRFRPGERLPSERDLVARTGANRSSVREAFRSLQTLGLIEIKPGGGARVTPIEQASLDILTHLAFRDGRPDPTLIEQWMEVQEILATGAIRLAVERADAGAITQARALVARLAEGEDAGASLEEIVEALFELIGDASSNLVLRMIRYRLLDIFERSFPGAPRHLAPPKGAEAMLRAIDAALEKRDADAVVAGVRAVLRLRRERLLRRLKGARGADAAQ